MNPEYIYFKEIKIDQDNTFTANFSKEKQKKLYLTKKANIE